VNTWDTVALLVLKIRTLTDAVVATAMTAGVVMIHGTGTEIATIVVEVMTLETGTGTIMVGTVTMDVIGVIDAALHPLVVAGEGIHPSTGRGGVIRGALHREEPVLHQHGLQGIMTLHLPLPLKLLDGDSHERSQVEAFKLKFLEDVKNKLQVSQKSVQVQPTQCFNYPVFKSFK